MGDYRIELDLVGGHGCDRMAKEGEQVTPCHRIGCPDCETRAFVQKLTTNGSSFKGGRFINWPGQVGEVVDELSPIHPSHPPVAKRVKGHF